MARLASRAIAGYYPLPEHLAPRIARLVEFRGGDAYGDLNTVFDPCAGDGAALLGMLDVWRPEHSFRKFARAGIEMEQNRARLLASRLLKRDRNRADLPHQALHADAFTVEARGGANLLYLNPPYDTDPERGRLEQKFLDRFTPALAPGGALLFVVPCSALAASARYLATWYADVRSWRFPAGPDFDAYRQVVVTGRKLGAPLPGAPGAAVIEAWGSYPMRCPELPETPIADPLRIPAGRFALALQALGFDRTELLANLRPWEGLPVGVDLEAGALQALRFPTALPTKPAHLALAIAAGHINGFRLDPDHPEAGDPPILLKGMFRKAERVLTETPNEDGDVVKVVTVEQPSLTMHAFRLDARRFWEPGMATGQDELERCSVLQLMGRYRGSLARLMARQFPPLHDPADHAQEIALPDLPKPPYAVQREAINASLKLLATGQNPKLIAEVGTGKTLTSLYIYAALTPRWHARTCAELERLGFDASRLPVVERALVLCPPHLLDTWEEEIHGTAHRPGCIPWAKVQIVRTIEDLRQEAELYILSRETAKLGHGHRGVDAKSGRRHDPRTGKVANANPAGTCPRCGRPLPPVDAETAASKRMTCGYPRRSPGNAWARIAEGLAEILLPVIPDSGIGRALTSDRRMLQLQAEKDEPRTKVDRGRILTWLGFEVAAGQDYPKGSIFGALLEHLRPSGKTWEDYDRPVVIVRELAFSLGLQAQVAEAFRELERRIEGHGARNAAEAAHELLAPIPPVEWRSPTAERRREGLRQVLDRLWRLATWDDRPTLTRGLNAPEGSRRRRRADAIDPDELPPVEICGEPLWQASPEPRRYPIARYICRRMPDRFDLLICDELHEFSNLGTAQSLAAHRLCELGIPVIGLTGSIMSGYASSLFPNWWALDRGERRFREQFPRGSMSAFVELYGLRKLVYTPRKNRNGESYGSQTDRRNWSCRVAGEAPGVVPLFILRHVLPAGVVVHKDELDAELPACTERQMPLPIGETEDDRDLMIEFERMTITLLDQIAADMFTPLSGKLWGAMMELPSYLDRCTVDQGRFELRYPENVNDGALVAVGRMWPAAYRTPKERALLAYLREQLSAGRRVIVFLRHVNSGLPERLLKMIREAEITERVAYLNASKVPAQKRKAWISREVVDKEADVLIVNPNAVKTGLNNLVWFSSAWWHETDYSAQTFRQANGRLHRIGQTEPVEIVVPMYPGTAQEVAVDLVARKVTASLQVDALGVQGALEASGSGESSREDLEATLAMGEAIYERLRRRRQDL